MPYSGVTPMRVTVQSNAGNRSGTSRLCDHGHARRANRVSRHAWNDRLRWHGWRPSAHTRYVIKRHNIGRRLHTATYCYTLFYIGTSCHRMLERIRTYPRARPRTPHGRTQSGPAPFSRPCQRSRFGPSRLRTKRQSPARGGELSEMNQRLYRAARVWPAWQMLVALAGPPRNF
jgi:hypothetical protein